MEEAVVGGVELRAKIVLLDRKGVMREFFGNKGALREFLKN